jgi:hypothetical protein
MSRAGRSRRLLLTVAAAIAAAGLLALAMIDARTAASGWLAAFVFWSQVPLGSLALLMIHRLTGGRWGEQLALALLPAARATPLLFILIIPVLVAIPTLYPWAHGASGAKPDVVANYLGVPWFTARSLIALAGWSILSFLLPRVGGRAGQLVAGLGLVFHCFIISLVAVDWVLTLEPPFISSSFGASMAITQLIAALAWAAIWQPAPVRDPVAGDIGGLLLAFVLGITYVDFMAVLVIWYGDLPHRVFWFVARDRFPWSAIAAGAFIFGSVVPIVGLLLSRVRNNSAELQVIGSSVLLGLALYHAYLVLPQFGALALVPAGLSLVAIGLLIALLMREADLDFWQFRSAAHGR